MIDRGKLKEAMINHLREAKSPDKLYEEYLDKHRQGCKDAYEKIKPILVEEGISPEELETITTRIDTHDEHKYDEDEWSAYRDHFYDPDNNPRTNSDAFNHAWNHHQNHSPHHWQYWCLINDVDEPQVMPLDMPFEYIIEMLCDWQSAGNHYGNTAYDWYEKQKNKMILSENTRQIVEKYIDYFKE